MTMATNENYDLATQEALLLRLEIERLISHLLWIRDDAMDILEAKDRAIMAIGLRPRIQQSGFSDARHGKKR